MMIMMPRPWIQCLFVLPLLINLLTASSLHHYENVYKTRALRSWGIFVRAGEQQQQQQFQQKQQQQQQQRRNVVAVGLVRRGKPSAMFYYTENNKNQVYSTPPLSMDMVEPLAITSDVMLITIDLTEQPTFDDTTTKEMIASTIRGAKRKQQGGYSKLAVLVVLTGRKLNQEEALSWKDRISLQYLGDMTPSLVESLDIVTEDEAAFVYQDVMQSLQQEGESMVTNHDEYTRLTQQVYESLHSKQCPDDFIFQPATAAFFETSRENINVVAASNIEQELKIPDHDKEHEDRMDQSMLQAAMNDLELLESQQDEVWLNADSQVPILHFGSAANAILEKASKALEHSNDKRAILNQMATKLQLLYQNQLQSLREHFGRKYESALEAFSDDDDKDQQQALTEAARRITEGFRTAAQHAIPELCRSGQELTDANFSYVSVLRGLLSDMMEATTMHQPEDDYYDDNGDSLEEQGKQPAKWYQKLAARALMLGINYAQGWLAWQGVRKAAAQRDKDMPKFPLF